MQNLVFQKKKKTELSQNFFKITAFLNKTFLKFNFMSKTTIESASAWEVGLDSCYTEDEVVSIMNMLSYIVNKRRGYGKKKRRSVIFGRKTS